MSAFFGINFGERQWAARWVGRAPVQATNLPDHQIVGPTYSSEPMWRISLEDIMAVMSRPSEEWTAITFKPTSLACGICFEDLSQADALRIPGCSHTFCVECLRTYTELKIHQSRYPIKCPGCSTIGGALHGNVEQVTIDKLRLKTKDLEMLSELQIAAFAVALRCPRCSKTTQVDRRDYIATTVLTCPLPLCQHSWCRDCELEVLDPSNNNHQCRNKKLERLMRRKGWRYCPGCRTPIQKISGCNHITCQSPGCSVHFCYRCGDLIMDASGGGNVSAAINTHYRRCRQYSRSYRIYLLARGLYYAVLSRV